MGKIDEAIGILESLGLPKAQQNDRSALTLLAVLDLKEDGKWSEARQRNIRIHDILLFIQSSYNRQYAENTRETIRRQTLHQLMQAGIVDINTDDQSRPTNSPNTVYTITEEALSAIKEFSTKDWSAAVNEFIKQKGKLIDKYDQRRAQRQIELPLPKGSAILLSAGKHNELQKEIIEEFRARFFPESEVVYIGDTARKMLHFDEELAKKLGIPITLHDKLPDVVLYVPSKNFLALIEAVTSHGPITPKRQIELEKVLEKCKAKRIYISVFPDFHQLKRHIDNIAWETEIWIADRPDHMIHFNGPKFLTAYQ